jgi:hypothetical protein
MMSSTTRSTILLGLVAGALAFAARTAGADGKELSPVAKQHLDLGVAAYKAHDYDTASKELEAAYAIDPSPQLLYTWAQAKRLGGHCKEAIDLYRRYGDASTTDDQRSAAQTGVSRCEAELAKSPPPPPVAPRPPVIAVVNQPPPPAPPPPPGRHWYQNTLGDVLLLGGVASTGVGIGFFVASGHSKDRADAASQRDAFDAALDKATTQRRIAIVASGVGAALITGAVMTFVLGGSEHHTVAVSSDGRALFVAGAF